jgi:hypothetical protein
MSVVAHLRDAVSAPVVAGGGAIAAEVTQRIMHGIDAASAQDDSVLDDMLFTYLLVGTRSVWQHAGCARRTA